MCSLKIKNVSDERIKVKMFHYSFAARSLDWFLNWPIGTFHSWYNIKATFKERFGLPSAMSYNGEILFAFKQRYDEKLIHAWERYRGLTHELEHSLSDKGIANKAHYLGTPRDR
jgi:hypothetical protein